MSGKIFTKILRVVRIGQLADKLLRIRLSANLPSLIFFILQTVWWKNWWTSIKGITMDRDETSVFSVIEVQFEKTELQRASSDKSAISYQDDDHIWGRYALVAPKIDCFES